MDKFLVADLYSSKTFPQTFLCHDIIFQCLLKLGNILRFNTQTGYIIANTAPGFSPSNSGNSNTAPRFHHFNWLYFDALGSITCTGRLKTQTIRCPLYKFRRVISNKFFQWRWFIVNLCCVSVSDVYYFLKNGRVAALFTFLSLNGVLRSLLFTELSPHAFILIIFFENIIEIIHIDRIASLGIFAELWYI